MSKPAADANAVVFHAPSLLQLLQELCTELCVCCAADLSDRSSDRSRIYASAVAELKRAELVVGRVKALLVRRFSSEDRAEVEDRRRWDELQHGLAGGFGEARLVWWASEPQAPSAKVTGAGGTATAATATAAVGPGSGGELSSPCINTLADLYDLVLSMRGVVRAAQVRGHARRHAPR